MPKRTAKERVSCSATANSLLFPMCFSVCHCLSQERLPSPSSTQTIVRGCCCSRCCPAIKDNSYRLKDGSVPLGNTLMEFPKSFPVWYLYIPIYSGPPESASEEYLPYKEDQR